MNFGSRLKELRTKHGYTQQVIADRIGVTKAEVSYYERIEHAPSPDVLIKLSYIFHVSTDYLLGINRNKVIDVSGLDDEDIKAVSLIVERLKEKKK